VDACREPDDTRFVRRMPDTEEIGRMSRMKHGDVRTSVE
jgi:hypothetical protein